MSKQRLWQSILVSLVLCNCGPPSDPLKRAAEQEPVCQLDPGVYEMRAVLEDDQPDICPQGFTERTGSQYGEALYPGECSGFDSCYVEESTCSVFAENDESEFVFHLTSSVAGEGYLCLKQLYCCYDVTISLISSGNDD